MENRKVKKKKKNKKKNNKKVLEISLGKILIRVIILIVIALGVIWLYNNKIDKNESGEKQLNTSSEFSNNTLDVKEKSFMLSDYIGIWQKYYINQKEPDYELNILSIENQEVMFDFEANKVAVFKQQKAVLNENMAEFITEMNNESSDWTIKGILTFENNAIKLKIKESQYEDLIPKIEIKFENKVNNTK